MANTQIRGDIQKKWQENFQIVEKKNTNDKMKNLERVFRKWE